MEPLPPVDAWQELSARYVGAGVFVVVVGGAAVCLSEDEAAWLRDQLSVALAARLRDA